MGKRRWTNDTRIVKPILEANGYFALNNGHNCNGSHTKFVNANGEVISVPKSINRMLWQRRSTETQYCRWYDCYRQIKKLGVDQHEMEIDFTERWLCITTKRK